MASLIQLEDSSATELASRSTAAVRRSSVKIPRRVSDQTCEGHNSVAAPTLESVKYRLLPGLVELEHRPSVSSAAAGCGAIEITGSVPQQARFGLTSVRCSREFVEHCLLPKIGRASC